MLSGCNDEELVLHVAVEQRDEAAMTVSVEVPIAGKSFTLACR